MPRTTTAAPTPTLDSTSLIEAHDAALHLFDERHLLEDLDAPRIIAQLGEIIVAGDAQGLISVAGLKRHASLVLQEVAQVGSLTRFLPRRAAETAHQYRSALGALLWGAALALGEDPKPHQTALPTVSARHGGPKRALAEDEILLMRLRALHLCERGGGRNRIALFHYLLAEAGARPSETTQLTPEAFDDPTAPTRVHLPGVTRVAMERTISLPGWARPLLAEGLAEHLRTRLNAHTGLIAYFGTAQPGGHGASASASGILTRGMADAGLIDPPEPSSILRWRLGRTEATQGARAAQARSGYKSMDSMYDFIGNTHTETAAPPLIRSGGYAAA